MTGYDQPGITNPENVDALTHQQIYDAFQTVNDQTAEVVTTWQQARDQWRESTGRLVQAVRTAVDGRWTGVAADTAVQALSDYGTRAGQLAELFEQTGQVVANTALAAVTTKAYVPAPVPVTADQTEDPTGYDGQSRAAQQAQDDARQVMQQRYVLPFLDQDARLPAFPAAVSLAGADASSGPLDNLLSGSGWSLTGSATTAASSGIPVNGATAATNTGPVSSLLSGVPGLSSGASADPESGSSLFGSPGTRPKPNHHGPVGSGLGTPNSSSRPSGTAGSHNGHDAPPPRPERPVGEEKPRPGPAGPSETSEPKPVEHAVPENPRPGPAPGPGTVATHGDSAHDGSNGPATTSSSHTGTAGVTGNGGAGTAGGAGAQPGQSSNPSVPGSHSSPQSPGAPTAPTPPPSAPAAPGPLSAPSAPIPAAPGPLSSIPVPSAPGVPPVPVPPPLPSAPIPAPAPNAPMSPPVPSAPTSPSVPNAPVNPPAPGSGAPAPAPNVPPSPQPGAPASPPGAPLGKPVPPPAPMPNPPAPPPLPPAPTPRIPGFAGPAVPNASPDLTPYTAAGATAISGTAAAELAQTADDPVHRMPRVRRYVGDRERYGLRFDKHHETDTDEADPAAIDAENPSTDAESADAGNDPRASATGTGEHHPTAGASELVKDSGTQTSRENDSAITSAPQPDASPSHNDASGTAEGLITAPAAPPDDSGVPETRSGAAETPPSSQPRSATDLPAPTTGEADSGTAESRPAGDTAVAEGEESHTHDRAPDSGGDQTRSGTIGSVPVETVHPRSTATAPDNYRNVPPVIGE